jgi:hypothetical protein
MRVQRVDEEAYFASLRHTGFLKRFAALTLALSCAAFTYCVTVNVLQWRHTPTNAARDVLDNPGAGERQQIDAGVMLTNDTLESLARFHRLADRDDLRGREARNFLLQIHQRSAR